MANIKYTGRAHIRSLSAADLKQSGVEGFSKTDFARGQSIEVADEVAEAIIGNPEIFGKFEVVERDAQADTKTEKVADADADKASTGSASTADAPTTRPSGRASTKSV